MEKIQSAIAKARAERKQSAPTRPLFRHREYEQEAGRAVSSWNDLPLLEANKRRLRSQRIVTVERNSDAAAFDKLRTRMLQQMQANNWRRVAITSPGPSSGKSTVALNLAYSVARQLHSSVILSEMDLRRPSLAKILRVKTARDFGNVLQHTGRFVDEGVRLRSNFGLGLLQGPIQDSAEILQNPDLADTINEIEEEFEPTVMMFDMPPFQVSDDVMAFREKLDCVLIVAAAEQTKMEDLDNCERELSNVTNVLGIALNKCRYKTPDAGYDYYG